MNNGHVTEARLNEIRYLHAPLPQTDVRSDDSIVVSSTKLNLGETLRIGWLSLQLLKIDLTTVTPVRINNSLGFAYLGIFAGGFEPLRRPSGLPITFINLSGPNVKVMNPYIDRTFSGPDVIEIVAVNNTADTDIEIMVSGSLKLYTHG
jgi:hypothetical protein